MKLVKHLGAAAGLTLALVILLPLMACSRRSIPDPAAPDGSPAESWRCRNDLEVSCADGACDAAAEDDFTSMEVHVDDSGAMSVCAVVIAIDRSDAVATLKVGAFAQPLLCESLGGAQ